MRLAHVSNLVQTDDGYLWMSTQSGLARFDGVRFADFVLGVRQFGDHFPGRPVSGDDPALNELITQAQATTDKAKQKQFTQQAAKLVRDNVYDNVMYTQNLYVAHSSEWEGFIVKPSELLSIVHAESVANARKTDG